MAGKKRAAKKPARAKRKAKRTGSFRLFVFLLLLAAAAAFYLLNTRITENFSRLPLPGKTIKHGIKPKPKPPGQPPISTAEKGSKLLLDTKRELEKNSSLFKSGIDFSDCSTSEHLSCLEVRLGSDTDYMLAKKSIDGLWDEQGFQIMSGDRKNSPSFEAMVAVKDDKRLAEADLFLTAKPAIKPAAAKPVAQAGKQRIAIVIDDLGVDYDSAAAVAHLLQPVALSILPFQKYSRDALELAGQFNKPAMLHMPMQPEDYPAMDPGDSALLISMTDHEIRDHVDSALDSMPGVIGVNNHMGSAFCAHQDLMRPVLEEISRKNIFFLDSKTSRNDVGFRTAREMKMKTCQRGVFLDNLRDENAIWQELVDLCWNDHPDQSRIAIGHPYPETIHVLRERLGELEQMGCEVAPIQEFCQ